MSESPIVVLVSYPDNRFEIVEIERTLDNFSDLVGGYIEMLPRVVDTSWAAYCNEDGKMIGLPPNEASTNYMDVLYQAAGAQPFSYRDHLVGNIVWFADNPGGAEGSVTVKHAMGYAAAQVRCAWMNSLTADPVLTVLRHKNDVWVFDAEADALIPHHVSMCMRAARAHAEHGKIECYTGITPGKWQELRVDIMDDFRITLHDERHDRSYG